MSKEKLREAIDAIAHVIDKHQGRLTRVLAAARAYACERCGGRRLIDNGTLGGMAICPDCAEWRRIADGGEG